MLTVKDLRNEFGLEHECDKVFHSPFCSGRVTVFNSFSGSSLNFNFDNKIEYFEFLCEASSLIESNIWGEVSFSSKLNAGVKHSKGIKQDEHDCLVCSIAIDKKTQEILDKYTTRNPLCDEASMVAYQKLVSSMQENIINVKQFVKLSSSNNFKGEK